MLGPGRSLQRLVTVSLPAPTPPKSTLHPSVALSSRIQYSSWASTFPEAQELTSKAGLEHVSGVGWCSEGRQWGRRRVEVTYGR